MADEDFLRRWARRKSEARQREEPVSAPAASATSAAPPAASPAAVVTPTPGVAPPAAPPTLPNPDHLEPGDDVSAFMAKGVDDLLRRKALKTLFRDPRFNVMDRMDVYIDDYSVPDPLPPDWLDKLEQMTHLGDKGARDRAEAEREAAREADARAAAESAEPVTAPAPNEIDVEPPLADAVPVAEAADTERGAAPENNPERQA